MEAGCSKAAVSEAGRAIRVALTAFVCTPREATGLEETTDEDLMLKVAKGDESAFRRLAKRHAAKTFALTRRMLGNDADAEEIVQEAMLRVWVNAPRWRPDAAFRTWLYRVTFNLCLNRRRQKVS